MREHYPQLEYSNQCLCTDLKCAKLKLLEIHRDLKIKWNPHISYKDVCSIC